MDKKTQELLSELINSINASAKLMNDRLTQADESTDKTVSENAENINELNEQLSIVDEVAIELYEMEASQQEINNAQDEALIELYELIGG